MSAAATPNVVYRSLFKDLVSNEDHTRQRVGSERTHSITTSMSGRDMLAMTTSTVPLMSAVDARGPVIRVTEETPTRCRSSRDEYILVRYE